MATRPALKRKVAKTSKDDLHVKIAETAGATEATPGEGGRYVYGIVEAKELMDRSLYLRSNAGKCTGS